MTFFDGFGLGEMSAKINPYIVATTPFLDELLGGKKLTSLSSKEAGKYYRLFPTDTTLEVEGTPQSATGQTALWTGVNSAEVIGEHKNGFPNQALRKIIEENNIFKQLKGCGKTVAFANAYRPDFFKSFIHQKKYHSVSTTAALSAGLKLKTIEDILAGKSVYQDMTNKILVEKFNCNVPVISPTEAGLVLGKISQELDFCLYEYFLTDIVGHSQDFDLSVNLIEQIDAFLEAVIKNVDLRDTLVIIVSDHGNIEDVRLKGHTKNKVPTVIISEENNLQESIKINSLTDVYDYIVEKLCDKL
ncbi:sulfatase-like hydrolase/transferase [Desulfitispora alkaliphila]|uniref:sulfatase-like hydrolase/transferase n=1 Tax=Desulfitispora alkaliphila TaxID=622674 RepID=UPI003D1DF084